MSDWDFLWELSADERLDAISCGMDKFDMAYIENEEEQERINIRNEKWNALKALRDSGSITREDFKKEKNIICAVEISRKKEFSEIKTIYKKLKHTCINNKLDFEKSKICGCYNCIEVFDVSNRIKKDNNNSALCPVCNNPTLILPCNVQDILKFTITNYEQFEDVLSDMNYYLINKSNMF